MPAYTRVDFSEEFLTDNRLVWQQPDGCVCNVHFPILKRDARAQRIVPLLESDHLSRGVPHFRVITNQRVAYRPRYFRQSSVQEHAGAWARAGAKFLHQEHDAPSLGHVKQQDHLRTPTAKDHPIKTWPQWKPRQGWPPKRLELCLRPKSRPRWLQNRPQPLRQIPTRPKTKQDLVRFPLFRQL